MEQELTPEQEANLAKMLEAVQADFSTLVALGSAIVHIEEYLASGNPHFKGCFEADVSLPWVKEWRDRMGQHTLLPRKHTLEEAVSARMR